MKKILPLLRCGSCRFVGAYFLAFYISILEAGFHKWYWVLLSAGYWLILGLCGEWINRLGDRTEDSINRPERTAICEEVGFHLLKTLSIAAWIILAISIIVITLLTQNFTLCFLALSNIVIAYHYSYGIRLKARRYLAYVALSFTTGFPLLCGWSLSHNELSTSWPHFVYEFGPCFLIVMLFNVTSIGIKDITDTEGDEKVGYQSLWISLIRRKFIWNIITVISTPFIVTVVFVGLDILASRFLLLLAFIPVSLLFAYCLHNASENEQFQAIREFFYYYWFVFLAAMLLLYLPTKVNLYLVLFTSLYWFLASHYLHWSGGLRLSKMKIMLAIFRRS